MKQRLRGRVKKKKKTVSLTQLRKLEQTFSMAVNKLSVSFSLSLFLTLSASFHLSFSRYPSISLPSLEWHFNERCVCACSGQVTIRDASQEFLIIKPM